MEQDSSTPTQWFAVITLALATLIIASELTMSSFALPLIASELDVTTQQTAWVLLAYSLPLAAMAIPAGRWVDSASVSQVFFWSLVIVGVTSVMAAVAPDFRWLLAARVLQGLASALYLAVYFPTIRAAVHVSKQGRAMSYIAMIMMIGSIAMAPLGGLVASTLGWREVFIAKLPLLLMVLWMTSLAIPSDRERGMPWPDASMLKETLLIGVMVTTLLMGLERFESNVPIAALLVLVSAITWVIWARVPSSMPVLNLIRRSRFGLPALALMLMSTIMGLVSFSLPFFVADVMQRSPNVLSVTVIAFVVAASVSSPAGGWLADRYGALQIAIVGAAIMVLGMLSMVSVTAASSVLDICWRMAWVGFGMALFNAPNLSAILKAAPEGQAGTAGGISNVARTLGNTAGPAVAALMWAMAGGGETGFQAGVVAMAGLCAVGTLALVIAWLRARRITHAPAPTTDQGASD